MNLKMLHKLQLKAALYKLIQTPGCLTDLEVYETFQEVTDEIGCECGLEK